MASCAPDVILAVRDLSVAFGGAEAPLHAVEEVSFDVRAGEMLAIVGESGCGKSVTALAVMGLLPRPAARITAGTIAFAGRDLATLDEHDFEDLRGKRLAMIFQEPMTALNPVMRIGRQIEEALLRHRVVPRRQARARSLALAMIPAPGSA